MFPTVLFLFNCLYVEPHTMLFNDDGTIGNASCNETLYDKLISMLPHESPQEARVPTPTSATDSQTRRRVNRAMVAPDTKQSEQQNSEEQIGLTTRV